MALNSNQFGQSMIKGQADLKNSHNTISAIVDAGQATPLVPGQAVTIVDSAGGAPKVIAAAADSDLIMGFVSYNHKQAEFEAGEALEISCEGNVIVLEAGAAVARGGQVMSLIAGEKVITATIGIPVVGIALDKAAADGDLIRVYVKSFGLHLAL